ncbi:hypothetical protein GCM10012275_18530 [Longimycelium tulufanense]|uniref:DUF541 domain-containing protein n=1 Tax=Longimycelium tulufanense TaxID=907463 RepID=A0A8J3FU57_9PSEU|nr:SIMPL domain-containing protein [Longimycelium tulufanense]GGM47766.1 hypothetical protein GCM10012275_18530 [Longimycelium tulufanense]
MAEVVTKGSGEVERIADRARLWVSFAATGNTRAEAVNALNARLADVETLLDTSAVEVRSRHLSVFENWQRRRMVGARAEQHYVLRVSDLTVLADLVSRLLTAEPASFNGPDWELSDDADAVRDAQREAVADARRRAEGYADALGTRLGPLLRLSDGYEGGGGFAPMAAAAPRAHQESVDVSNLNLEPQLVTVSASCTTAWSLLD